jgi:hypothetical protein
MLDILYNLLNFFYNLLYYNSIGVCFGIMFFLTCEYVSHPENFITNTLDNLQTIKHWILDKIISFYTLYNDLFKKKHVKKMCTFSNKDYKKIFHNDNIYYISNSNKLYNNNEINDNDIQKHLFLGITIIINKKRYNNVKEHLDKFMIVNAIFDKNFIKMFMKEFYNVNNINGYEINFIDNYCSPFILNETQILYIGNDYYEIKNEKENTSEIDNEDKNNILLSSKRWNQERD